MGCSCGSRKEYSVCCGPFHDGKVASTAVELMRSRYAAYALGKADYIIKTTHPGSPQFVEDKEKWTRGILQFSSHTQFKGVEILGSQENESSATVTFTAHLVQDEKDVSFTEKSYFEKIHGKWLYQRGQLAEGKAPNLLTTETLRILPLAYYGHPILRKIGEQVSEITDDVRTLIEEMIETMDAYDGIGLAAPQVHHSIQLFIIRKPIENKKGKVGMGEIKVFINAKLSSPSKETWEASEGCLSIPTIRGEVKRPKQINVEYTNLQGERIKERVNGWEARVVMHEYDHTQGILFIDHLEESEKERLKPFLEHLKNRIHDGTEL